MKITLLITLIIGLQYCASTGEQITESAYNGDLNSVQNIISKTNNPDDANKFGWTPLMSASEGGQLKVVEYLILKNSGLNIKNENGDTALIRACVSGEFEVVKILLNKGASPNLRNLKGYSPLMKASERGYKEIVNLLIQNGAKVNQIPIEGTEKLTALHLAALEETLEVMNILLSNNADINALDSRGFTPLMVAIENNKEKSAKLLIDKGANTNIESFYGDTVFTLLEGKKNKNLKSLFK